MAEELDEKEEGKKGGEQAEKPKGKSPKKLIILLVAVLVLGGGGFYVWNSGMFKGNAKEKKKPHAAQAAQNKIDIGPIRPMDAFIVNLADPAGKRYLKVRMDLELNDEKMVPEMDKRLPQLRDAILTTLSSKNFEEISGLDGKMQLRAEIMALLNQVLKTGKVSNIYFTEFIVQ